MKFIKQAVIVATLAISPLTLAEEAKDPTTQCTKLSQLVEMVGKLRYSGIELSSMLAKFDNKSMRGVILAVYSEPRMRVRENQDDQIARLKEEAFMACYKELN